MRRRAASRHATEAAAGVRAHDDCHKHVRSPERAARRRQPDGPADQRSRDRAAVNGVSYQLHEGETLAVVGESGSGKSVHYLSMVKLIPTPPCRIVAGSARFAGDDLVDARPRGIAPLLGKRIGNRVPGSDDLAQSGAADRHPVDRTADRASRSVDCGRRACARPNCSISSRIPNPDARLDQYPHQFSGGMRQRVDDRDRAVLRAAVADRRRADDRA